MAEPMDVDIIHNDFDNKENSTQHNNLLPRTPCTEKGYEELDVSELNMKLRYSITPVSSPMSKSYTANCADNKNQEFEENVLNANLTRSFNSAIPRNDVNKSLKTLPLQSMTADQLLDNNRNVSVLRPLDTTTTVAANTTITVTEHNDIDDNLSIPSTLSSNAHTPEVTTPTKDIAQTDGGSPIMRGLKTVLNMFRSSQSPIPPENDGYDGNNVLSPPDIPAAMNTTQEVKQPVLASTPIAAHKNEGNSSKRNSPLKESIVFNEDLEKELLWKEDSTVLFSEEKIPIHKLLFQHPLPSFLSNTKSESKSDGKKPESLNTTVEYMDVSYNDTITLNRTLTDIKSGDTFNAGESDSEFVDCETTLNDDVNVQTPRKSECVTDTLENKQPIIETNPVLCGVATSPAKTEILEVINQQLCDVTQNMSQLQSHTTVTSLKNDVAEENGNKIEDISTIIHVDSQNLPSKGHLKDTLENKQPIIETNPVLLGVATSPAKTEILEVINQQLCDVTQNMSQLQSHTTVTSLKNDVAEENGKNIEDISTIIHVDSQNLPSKGFKIDSIVESCTKDAENIPSNNEQGNTQLNKTFKSEQKLDKDNLERIKNDIIPVLSFSEPCEDKDNIQNSSTTVEESKIIPIEDVMKNKILDVQNIPANTPLPDEDEIEFNVDPSNYNTNTKLESTIPIDNVPLEITDEVILVENKLIKQNMDLESVNACNIKEIKNIIGESPTTTKNFEHTGEYINLENVTDQTNVESVEILKIITDSSRNDITNAVNEINNAEKAQNVHLNDFRTTACSDCILEKCIDINSKPNELNKIQGNDSTQKDKDTSLPEKIEVAHELNLKDQHTEDKMDISSARQSKADDNKFNTSEQIEIPISDALTLGANDIKSEILPDLVSDTISDAPAQIPSESTDKDIVAEISNIDQNKQNLSKEHTIDNQMVKEIEIDENVKEEEIQLSENNSPYISITGQIELTSEKVISNESENPFTTATKEAISPPLSQKNVSKGYNFNFDDIDDPFATKTKIRLSPPLESLNRTFSPAKTISKESDKNKRKSQSERKRPICTKKNVNNTSGIANVDEKPVKKFEDENLEKKPEFENINTSELILSSDTNNGTDIPTSTLSDNPIFSSPISASSIISETEINASVRKEDDKQTNVATEQNIGSSANIEIVESLSQSIDIQNTSSSEQSTYYSAATSSGESFVNKNVFNIPEIEDLNFNPFTTKSKVRLSPSSDNENSYIADSLKEPSQNMEDNTVVISDEKESADISNTTCSSKATDEKDITVKEILTEDEDTMEGPFLETEDVNVDNKMCDDDNNDFMLSKLPKQGNEDNLDPGELFIDADAFEFLLNQNQHNAVAESAKESLFLKFDPLFANRVSTDGVLSVLKNIQKRQSTPQKASGFHLLDSTFEKPIEGPSKENNTQEEITNTTNDESSDDLNVTVTKPTMVVTPAVNPITQRTKSTPVANSSRRSITFTSPAIAVIDRLLSMSGNNSILGDTTVTQVNTEQNEADIALIQLREMLADKEIHVYNLRTETKELKDRLSNLESQMRTLESESAGRLKKINDLNETLHKKTELNKSMAAVVEEYERTIASLITEKEQDKKRHNEERRKLIQERDEQTAHLASMEVSFSDLHNKYEKSKQIIFTYKANEDAYKKSIKEFEDNISKTLSNYELLKQHATSKLNHANQELEKINRAHDAEVLKLNAMIKRKDVHITSLEETLTQKTKANEELAAICDELINKVG